MSESTLERYLGAVRAGDRRRAFQVVRRARAQGMDPRELYLQVFQPALREIGRLWQENEISVADEHLATAITQAAMAGLFGEVLADAPPADPPVLVAACADTERHEIGLRMVCDFLEMEGWDTVFLGSSVPVEDLVRMVHERRPDAVALSVALTPHLPRVRAMVRGIRDTLGDRAPVIAVGGRPFVEDPALAEQVGADLTAADAADAAVRLRERVGR